MAIVKSPALVLRRHDLRETSLLVNFFTRDYGKIIGEMKGVRADPKKFASPIDTFSLNEIIYYQKKSGYHLVSQCDLSEHYAGCRLSAEKITGATAMMELVDAVMPAEDVNREIFDLSVRTLSALCTQSDIDRLLMIFKIKVISLSGFKPHLSSCVCCDSRAFSQIKFSLSLGGLLCPKCFPKDFKARSIFRGTVATIMHIEKNDFSASLTLGMNPQIKKELDLVLNSFLNFHIGRELRSERTMDKLAGGRV